MIKRIELVNFMSHSHTVIEPAEGLTVLVGPNNCGKSAVMSALQILCHNDTSTYVTKHGEKECSITVETSAGDVVQWSRVRNSTKYVINGETFDRLRGNVPPVLHDVLRLPKVQLEQSPEEFDIHFGSQKDPVFLINESGRAAAGFFAASSDASRLIEMQKLHSQKVKEAGRDLKRLDAEADELKQTIERLTPAETLKREFARCRELIRSIEYHEKAYSQVNSASTKIRVTLHRIAILKQQSHLASQVSPPPQLHPTTTLRELAQALGAKTKQANRLCQSNDAVCKIAAPPKLQSTTSLTITIRRWRDATDQIKHNSAASRALQTLAPTPQPNNTSNIREIVNLIRSSEATVEKLSRRLQKLVASISKLDSEIEEFIAVHPTCPTCNQRLSKAHLTSYSDGGRSG